MVNASTGELKALGVPFFALRKDLISPDNDGNDAHIHDNMEIDGASRSGEQKLRLEELYSLQRRVIELLEDLCND